MLSTVSKVGSEDLQGFVDHSQGVCDCPVVSQWWKSQPTKVSKVIMLINNINWKIMTILIIIKTLEKSSEIKNSMDQINMQILLYCI